MNDPKELKIIEQFPDDLKGMLRDLKVPLDDPVISLLAWIWKQMNETKETIDNAKMTVTAVLQERLDKMRQTADLLISTNGHLKEIDEQFDEKDRRKEAKKEKKKKKKEEVKGIDSFILLLN